MRIQTASEIGLLVRETRRDRGWSQDQLADAVGATRQWVARLEAGRARVELALTLRALRALGITVELDRS